MDSSLGKSLMLNNIEIGATLDSVGSSMSNGMNSLAAGNMALNIALYEIIILLNPLL
jgi:hypothetical protein